MNGLLCLSFSRTQKSAALSSCEAEVLAMTAGASEALLLKAVWTFMVQQRCEVEMRSLCWLQSALKQRTLDVLPIGTKLNLADLNTKKLSQARRQFLLYFLGVVRLNDEGKLKERVGEQEYLDCMASEMWKQQIQNVTRWSKNRTHKLVQCAMMLQAISLKGCGEQDAPESAEQSSNHQVVYTLVILMILGVCNYLYTQWNDFQRLRERLGRKRKREEVQVHEPEPEVATAGGLTMNDELNIGANEQASSSEGPASWTSTTSASVFPHSDGSATEMGTMVTRVVPILDAWKG